MGLLSRECGALDCGIAVAVGEGAGGLVVVPLFGVAGGLQAAMAWGCGCDS